MTATPRTDAALYPMNGVEIVWPDFARTLETELACEKTNRNHLIEKGAKLETELACLRAELVVEKNWVEHHSQHADDLIGENVKLRAEVERLTKQIKDDNRSYGCELRDPNGTIWEQAAKDHARAERAEAERDALAKDKARLDWLSVSDAWFDYPATGAFTPDTMRAAIDSAMKEDTP